MTLGGGPLVQTVVAGALELHVRLDRLQIVGAAGVQTVQHRDLIVVNQRLCQVGADESRSLCDQYIHNSIVSHQIKVSALSDDFNGFRQFKKYFLLKP